MIKSLEDLLREYNSQSESNKETEGKALDGFVQDGGGCTCCPGSGDDQFECCNLAGCLACTAI